MTIHRERQIELGEDEDIKFIGPRP